MEIAIISGKGGTGKSSIAAAFASLEENVTVADCDVDAANLYLLFNPNNVEQEVYVSGYTAKVDQETCNQCGLCIDYCRFEAIGRLGDQVVFNEIACEGCKLCYRVCPQNAINLFPNNRSRMISGRFRYGSMVYGRLSPGEENSGKLVTMVRDKATEIAKNTGSEIVIIDGPPGIGCPVIAAINSVDKVIVVTEPTLSGLNDLIRAANLLNDKTEKTWVIINKYDLNSDMTSMIGEWCNENGICVAGKLPFEPMVVNAMVAGKTITEHAPGSQFGISVSNIWQLIKKH